MKITEFIYNFSSVFVSILMPQTLCTNPYKQSISNDKKGYQIIQTNLWSFIIECDIFSVLVIFFNFEFIKLDTLFFKKCDFLLNFLWIFRCLSKKAPNFIWWRQNSMARNSWSERIVSKRISHSLAGPRFV